MIKTIKNRNENDKKCIFKSLFIEVFIDQETSINTFCFYIKRICL